MPVLVVGSYNCDMLFRSEQLPVRGETRLGTFATAHGGKGFNQAVAAHRAGAETTFSGALGDDAQGEQVRAFATAIGLRCRWQQGSEPTGVACVVSETSGENQIVVAPGANLELTFRTDDLPDRPADGCTVLLAQQECSLELTRQALADAAQRGALAMLNPAPADLPGAETLLDLTDLVTPNEAEFAALLAARTGETLPADWASAPPEQLQGWCGQLGGGTVVITMGRRGGFFSVPADNYWQLPETYGRFEAFSVSAIDTTGAGDAFNGNLAAALAGGEALQPALTRAAAAAALSTTALGAAPSMPDAAAVDQLLTTFPVTN
ncbi:MAG: PfkB family carbohydrate kinase [Pseudomonadota bacterium]